MRRALGLAVFGMAGLLLVLAPVGAQEKDREKKAGADQEFVRKASAAGLAGVNLSSVAVEVASNADVKAFAQKMVADHGKLNRELLDLANKKMLSLAEQMDEKHDKLRTKLLSLSGSAFDRAYIAAQVEDHKATVKLFENEARGGKDAEVKGWATKTLPALKQHLETARKLRSALKGEEKKEKKG
jgi:putative membrane protein